MKPIPQVNVERRAKRAKKYAAHLRSAFFRALRLVVFARDGWQCVEEIGGIRCPFIDETHTGKGLVCDHIRYTNFGNESPDDLQTRCRSCDKRCTPLERPNWAQPRRRNG